MDDARQDNNLYRRGQLFTALSRWLSLALGSLALALLWNAPGVRPLPALAVGAGYALFALGVQLWQRRYGRRRALRLAHDVVDALAVGAGAVFTGAPASPVWLFLYPHVVAVSVRGGLRYALAMGVLDGAIVAALGGLGPGDPFYALYALSLVWCAFMGGTVSSYLQSVQQRLGRANASLLAKVEAQQRMEAEVTAHAERLAAINEIANAVNRNLTSEDIFKVAAEESRRIVPFDRLTIVLLDDRSNAVELVSVGDGTHRLRAEPRRDELAWAFRRPAAWHDGSGEPAPRHLHALIADAAVRSAATLPLQSKERVIGALCLGRLEPRPFAAGELAVLEPVASHVAIALDNARLLEAVRRRGREFESLVEISRRIVERLEPSEILPLVTRSVNRVMGTHFCLLMLREGELLRAAAQEGLEPEVMERFATIRVGESLTGRVAEEGRPVSVADMRGDPRTKFADVVERHGYRACLCVPLLRGGEVLGTLEVVSKEPRSFGQEELDILTAFAGVTAVAIDHARLFQETRKQMDALAAANLRLEDLDRLRQEYLRNISHEFRTPLTVIRGWAEYLRGAGVPDEAALKDVMRIVIESCDRVIDMVDTLIEVSRVEQGAAAATLQVQTLDVAELVQASLEPLRAAADKKGLRLDSELPGSLLAQGDGGLLQQVVRKLVDNAIKYSGKHGRVAVSGQDDSDFVELRVRDEGVGIAPEHLPRIFEKFYVVDGSLTRRVGGSGVGLYLVREILRLHGGSVAVQSEPGRGSLFTVRLPKRFAGAAAP